MRRKGDEERIRDAGAEGYVSKPISVMRFVEAVRALLEAAASGRRRRCGGGGARGRTRKRQDLRRRSRGETGAAEPEDDAGRSGRR